MLKIAIVSAAAALVIAASAPSNAVPADSTSLAAGAAAMIRLADSIPPNCTLDPFTGKMNCPILPTCTMDPWTGKMNCPPRRNRVMLQFAT